MKPPAKSEVSTSPPDDESTGLPWPRSWRGVYLFVLGCFATYVVLLTVFGRYFA